MTSQSVLCSSAVGFLWWMRRFVCSPVACVGGVGSFGLVSSLCHSGSALDAPLPEFQQGTKSIKKPFWKHTVPSEFVVVKWSKINHWCCDKWVLWHYFYRPCKSNFLIKSADKTSRGARLVMCQRGMSWQGGKAAALTLPLLQALKPRYLGLERRDLGDILLNRCCCEFFWSACERTCQWQSLCCPWQSRSGLIRLWKTWSIHD